MVVRFEVGKIYFTRDSVYDKSGKVVYKKRYWLCVKRNDDTHYVSFRRIVDGVVINTTDSRKVEVFNPARYGFGGPTCERVTIGYGGSGAWRNYHVIYAEDCKN